MKSLICLCFIGCVAPVVSTQDASQDAEISTQAPTCALVPFDGGMRSDRFLQDGSEGDFWCSTDGGAVQGVSPLEPNLDGGVLCACPTGTACAPIMTEIGQPAVSCWVMVTP